MIEFLVRRIFEVRFCLNSGSLISGKLGRFLPRPLKQSQYEPTLHYAGSSNETHHENEGIFNAPFEVCALISFCFSQATCSAPKRHDVLLLMPNPFDYKNCIQLASLSSGDKLAGELRDTPSLKARGRECCLVGLKSSVVARKRCAVGISGFELNRVGITRANNDRSPVIERHVQADNCRFLAAVLSGATGK